MFHNSSTRSVSNVSDITMIRARASSVVTITTKDTNIIGLECAGFLYINSAGCFIVITKSINVTIYGMLILY